MSLDTESHSDDYVVDGILCKYRMSLWRFEFLLEFSLAEKIWIVTDIYICIKLWLNQDSKAKGVDLLQTPAWLVYGKFGPLLQCKGPWKSHMVCGLH